MLCTRDRSGVVCYDPRLRINRKYRFILIFGLCLLAGFGALFTPPVHRADVAFSRSLVGGAHSLIRVCGGHATREEAILRAPGGFAVEMRDGCNAINVTILLWSAVLAFPATWRMKILGLAAGSALIQIVNILRFISLFYLGQYSATWFEFAHSYLWETLIVLDTMIVFWFWVSSVLRDRTAQHAEA